MKNGIMKRILSFALCVSMLLPVFPAGLITIALPSEDDSFEANVGKQVVFDWWANFYVAEDDNGNPGEFEAKDYDDLEISERIFCIDGYYYDSDSGEHWYKLSARKGETMPEFLSSNPWVLFASDDDVESGADPSLCVYDEDDTIVFVNSYVIAGPSDLSDAEITVTYREDADYPVSSLAYTETTYGTVFSMAFDMTVIKANGELWTATDGLISVRYVATQLGSDTYTEDVCCGAAFVYVGNNMFSAASTDRWGYESSDVVYTNSGVSTIVFEHMLASFEYVGETGYFANTYVTLYDNNLNGNIYTASQLPSSFSVEYIFDVDGVEYYWLESRNFIGSPYFIAKASDVSFEMNQNPTDSYVTVTDGNGNIVGSELSLPMYEKTEITANSSLTQITADVDYQWQIEYEDGKWVDIYGENGKTVKLSFGMVANLLDEDGKVDIRCKTTSGNMTAYSGAITVTIEMYQPEEPDVVVSESFVSTSGETVTVTVTGSIPDDASLSLGETDSEGIEIGEGETFVAALDISVKNADGTEWQPESGESVTVELPASALGLSEGDEFVVYHLHNDEVRILGSYTVTDGKVSFDVDGFSKFVFVLASSVKDEEIPEAPDFSGDIGKHAHFTYSDEISIFVSFDEPTADNIGDAFVFDLTEFSTDFTVSIEDYRVVTETRNTFFGLFFKGVRTSYLQSLWYQVKVVKGDSPEDFVDYCWVMQNYITEGSEYEYDTFTLFDAPVVPDEPDEPEIPDVPEVSVTVNGEPVTEIGISLTESATINTATNIPSADISYSWQICYDIANDLWVDITGQNKADLQLTAGMVISLIDENNQVKVRCVATAGSLVATSDAILVTLSGGATEDPVVEIFFNGESFESIDIFESEKSSFAGELTSVTNLSGDLTYSWEVLFDPADDVWKVLGREETFIPSFDRYNYGAVYIGNVNYVHTSETGESAITLRLNVSDGVSTATDTFVINLKSGTVLKRFDSTKFVHAASGQGADGDAGDTIVTYNVIIQYLNQDGTVPVSDPYTSTVSPSTILTNTVSFPKVTGFVPMVYDSAKAMWVRSDSYKFDGTPFTKDFTLEVRYFPDAVEYTVNIYAQNAENDEYTLYKTYTDEELTGTVLDEISYSIPGYYQSKFSSNNAEIAADGSTVFNLYYDRIYYLMKFDLDGGYGVQPIYARHGVKLDIPNPTKAGYTFVGWDQTSGIPAVENETLNDGISNTMYEYMPIGNTSYKAIWEAVDNAKVTIVYWGENPNDEGYSYLESQEIYVKPGTELTFGTDQLICALTPHTHGSNCTYNCGKTVHTHSVEAGCYKLDCDKESHSHAESGCTLKCAHSSHTLDCYSTNSSYRVLRETNKPSQTLTNLGNGIYTYTSGSWYNQETHYYLYLNNKWYTGYSTYYNDYRDTTVITLSCTHGHTDVCYSCGLNEGTHVHSVEQNCYDLICNTEVHTHSDKCYACVAHTHNDDCYLKANRLDSSKYYYVKSDKVTVAPDGSTVMNVYYDRVEYSVEFHTNQNCTNEYTNLRITAKWGASILDKWPTYNGSSSWNVAGKSDTWQNSIQIMPIGGAKFWGPKTGSSSYKAYYYVEALPGETDTVTQNGVKYILHHTDTSSSRGNVTIEEQYDIEGFKYKEGTEIGSSYNNAKFYYVRATYLLEFNNGEDVVRSEAVKYQYDLSPYDFVPTAPSYYEAGSVEFAGWYQNPECTGEEVKLDAMTMPSHNVLLYAKWVPVKHNVTVYRYRDASGNLHDLLCNHTDEAIDGVEGLGSIAHGDLLNKHYIPEKPENGNYTFVTWAYYDKERGEEVTIDINSFVVTKDVEIYAKWSSNVQIPFTIKYVIKGTDTEIAERSEGKHYAGETHTFDAKTAGQLKPDYQEGYFPTVTSHSIDFKAEDNSYEYTFFYVQKATVPYTVYYVTDKQNEDNSLKEISLTEDGETKTYYIVADTKQVNDNRKAIVTENFKTVWGYMPDAYQKTLIVDGSDGAVNQIIFKYSVNTTQAYYKVTHYTEQIDGSWFVHSTYENIGTIGATINEKPMDIQGFTYDRTEYKVGDNEPTTQNSPLTGEGLEINLYYVRNKYAYTVEYREQGTEQLLHTVPDLEKQYYGDTVSHTAPQYWEAGDVYERVSNEKRSVIIQTDETKNLIVFYYKEREVTIKYEVANGLGGTVNPSQETVLIKTGDPEGSVAEALPGYKFLGWYDQSGNKLSSDLKFVPQKVNGLNVSATYLAKFEELEATLNYVVVGPDGRIVTGADGCGSVTPDSETLKVSTGVAKGSTATATSNVYKFVGWYSDATCTKLLSTNATYVPTKAADKLWVDGTTYYAKFEYNLTSLTIKKSGSGLWSHIDPNQTFIFNVKGKDVDVNVTVHGDGSVKINGLTVGEEYTVTEITGWSWRYSYKSVKDVTNAEKVGDVANGAKIKLGLDGTITFTNDRTVNKWLDGDSWCNNVFK